MFFAKYILVLYVIVRYTVSGFNCVFRKRDTNYRALLRKMAEKDKASYGSWPPCKLFLDSIESWSSVFGMGWLQSVGSIKLKVSFAEYRLFYRALLQKRPVILSILLTKATPQDNDVSPALLCVCECVCINESVLKLMTRTLMYK